MALFGYTPERRSAFWQWIYANRVPHIRISAKRILFDERQVMDWLNKRNTQPKRK